MTERPEAALGALRTHLAAISRLDGALNLLHWDQQTMMPSGGAGARAEQLATLESVIHERRCDERVGGWLDEIDAAGGLTDVDADMVRVARRDHEQARRVPTELAAELTRAAADGQEAWLRARADDDAPALMPALERNVRLAREYADCFPEVASPYDALLDIYDPGVTAVRVGELFAPLRDRLPELVGAATERATSIPAPGLPVAGNDVVGRAIGSLLRRSGLDDEHWRVDVSAHPFAIWTDRSDVRITTRYEDGVLQALLAAMHEFGHALYERQSAPGLDGTGLAGGTSMSWHESQSKLWEDHVARDPGFCSLMAHELTAAGCEVGGQLLHTIATRVEAGPIRVVADPVSFPLHIMLRFELEQALIEGTLAVADLPAAFRDGMRELLSVEAKSDREAVLQDVHWPAGAFGYFPSYAIGGLICAQLWETIGRELGDAVSSEALATGETAPLRAWLAEHVHGVGRRLDTDPLVERATGSPLSADAFLRRAAELAD